MKLNPKEVYFMEFLPLLPSDDPANKQPVEVSATTLSRNPRISIKNKITCITLYQLCNHNLANQPVRLHISIGSLGSSYMIPLPVPKA